MVQLPLASNPECATTFNTMAGRSLGKGEAALPVAVGKKFTVKVQVPIEENSMAPLRGDVMLVYVTSSFSLQCGCLVADCACLVAATPFGYSADQAHKSKRQTFSPPFCTFCGSGTTNPKHTKSPSMQRTPSTCAARPQQPCTPAPSIAHCDLCERPHCAPRGE